MVAAGLQFDHWILARMLSTDPLVAVDHIPSSRQPGRRGGSEGCDHLTVHREKWQIHGRFPWVLGFAVEPDLPFRLIAFVQLMPLRRHEVVDDLADDMDRSPFAVVAFGRDPL